ncbi:MAG: DNA polymerase IV [Planctomycetes bacterium]|nr:DNA polymerase IV [Planctomycetota bacterium]
MLNERYIVHVDMDAFFAAIEQRDNPSLRGKPVIVGSDPKGGKGRGVVSTCSYEARKFGIHSAMPISEAYRRCPTAIFLPVDMEKYSRVSGEIFKLLYEFTPVIEPVSIDEAFLDITESYKIFGTPLKTCALIKERIKKETGLTASLGMAPVKMVAKIASDLKKPDGFVEVKAGKVREFLNPLPIRKLWGLGEKSEIIFNRMGIKTIGQLARMDEEKLVEILGENGRHLLSLSKGIDPREVVTEYETKSVSKEFTFDVDTLDKKKIEATLMLLCEGVSANLRAEGLKGRTITLKIRLEGFETYTRAATITEPTNFEDVIYQEIKTLYNKFETRGKRIRLLGVKVSHFGEVGIQTNLFEKPDRKKEELHKALDAIKKKFGDDAIHRATVIKNKDESQTS